MNETHPTQYDIPLVTINANNGFSTPSVGHWPLTGTNLRQGSSLRNWRELIESGSDATTSFIGEKHTFKSKPMDAWVTGVNSLNLRAARDEAYGGFWATSAVPVIWNTSLFTAADNQARSAYYRKLRKAQVQVSGPTFLGELREAVHMIRHPAYALRRGLTGYFDVLSTRRARNPGKKQRRRVLQDTWLEYSFGWAPLIGDIQSGLEAYRGLLRKEEHQRIQASGKVEADLGAQYGELYGNRIWFNYQTRRTQSCTVRYIASVRATKTGPDDAIGRAMDSFGFRWDEFIPTAWELLPWSFFIDYFSNIGEVLSANATSEATVNWGVLTARYSGMSYLTQQGPINKAKTKQQYSFGGINFADCGGEMGEVLWTRTRVERSKISSVGLPTLRVRLPGSNVQFLNLWALFSSNRRVTPFF